MSGFIVVVVLLGLVWLFVILPVRRRQKQTTESHEAMQDALVPGDEIITAGGLYATIRTIEDERLEVEIAPGVIVTMDRRAVAAVAEDVEEDEPEPESPAADQPENDGKPR